MRSEVKDHMRGTSFCREEVHCVKLPAGTTLSTKCFAVSGRYSRSIVYGRLDFRLTPQVFRLYGCPVSQKRNPPCRAGRESEKKYIFSFNNRCNDVTIAQ